VNGDENRELLDELRRTLAARRAEGEVDPAWVEDEVEIVDAGSTGPVDRFLQTPRDPPELRRLAARALRRPIPGHEPGAADARLREAIAWLKLVLDEERGAREGLGSEVARIESAIERRLASVETSLRELGHSLGERVHRLEDDRRWLASLLLRERYRDLAAVARPSGNELEAAEARVFSQNGEDGIILYLFSRIGVTDRRFVEIGIEDGRECNTANLAINLGWSGLMIDHDAAGVDTARRRFAARPETAATVTVEQAHVTRENIDAILARHGVGKELDLLSIDIDGNDLWVWEAVNGVRPRIVVVEYNATFGPRRSVSVPYDPGFDRMARHPSGWYHGASVTALARLGARKGYLLAGCDSNGVNAFFVREDCAGGAVAAVAPESAWRAVRERGPRSTAEQFAVIADLPLDEVP
jgi:hypothetical protein